MIITTIKSNGTLAQEVRQVLSEHYDMEMKAQHTPDGSDLLIELALYPKGSLTLEKPPKRKHNRI